MGRINHSLWAGLILPILTIHVGIADERAVVPTGLYSPLYGLEKDQKEFKVNAFEIDRLPVTKNDFSKFINKNMEWRPDQVKRMLAEKNYLHEWKRLSRHSYRAPHGEGSYPVTNVSYFAAQAYCKWRGGRLPSTLEWEYVAAASEKKANASKDPEFSAKILAWYSAPQPPRLVKQRAANYYGVYDLHGLVWEWTGDYNSSFITGDNRQDGEKTKDFFCGNSATGSENREAYAAFMRYAMRGTLEPSFTIEKLGFRCAYDKK